MRCVTILFVRGHLSVQNSMQCFSGCALQKLFALFVVVRCRELGWVSKVYKVMHFELVRKRNTRREHVIYHVLLLTHGWADCFFSSWFTCSAYLIVDKPVREQVSDQHEVVDATSVVWFLYILTSLMWFAGLTV